MIPKSTLTANTAAEERRRATTVAAFLLETATELGVSVGYSGDEIATLSTTRVPLATITALERALNENKRAIIDILQQAERRGAAS
jgi:hypothetical protein